MAITNKYLLAQGYTSSKGLFPRKPKKSIRLRNAVNADNISYKKPSKIVASYDAAKSDKPGLTLLDGSLKLSPNKDSIEVQNNLQLWGKGTGLNGQISQTGGILDTSAGNDLINILYGSSYFLRGLDLEGSIYMGDGDDTLYSDAGLETNINVYNGLLDMGSGNDAIYTSHSSFTSTGVSINSRGAIYLGDGDDLIACDRNYGNSSSNAHISVFGLLDTGSGNDRIDADSLQVGIGGFVLMGSGDDIISARIEGSNGSRIDFGEGQDSLLLGRGEYYVSEADDGWLSVTSTNTSLGSYLFAGLEYVGGIGSDSTNPFQSGSGVIS